MRTVTLSHTIILNTENSKHNLTRTDSNRNKIEREIVEKENKELKSSTRRRILWFMVYEFVGIIFRMNGTDDVYPDPH